MMTTHDSRSLKTWLGGMFAATAALGMAAASVQAQQNCPPPPHCPQYVQPHNSLCPPPDWNGGTPAHRPLTPVPGLTPAAPVEAPVPSATPAVPSQPSITPTPAQPSVPSQPSAPQDFTPNTFTPQANPNGGGMPAPMTGGTGGGSLTSSLASSSTDSVAMPGMIGDFLAGNNFTYQPLDGGLAGDTFSSPALTRSFKIIENQNPQPVNRVFGKVNYFDNVGGEGSEIYRYVVGMEKTIFDGQASVQLKLPFFVVDGGATNSTTSDGASVNAFTVGDGMEADVGDIVATFKYAAYRDVCTGDVWSVGLSAVLPTGPDTIADVNALTDTDIDHRGSIQPFTGFRAMMGSNFFVQGFSALDIPIDSDDATLWYNSLGAGYLYDCGQGSWISALVPQLEVHANSPINNDTITVRSSQFANSRGLGFSAVSASLHDQVNMTMGLTAVCAGSTDFTLAVTRPLAGPNPFDYEVHAQINVYFDGMGQFGNNLNPLNW